MEWITEFLIQEFGDCPTEDCLLCAEKYQALRRMLAWCQIGIFSFFSISFFLLGIFTYRKKTNRLDIFGLLCFGVFFSILTYFTYFNVNKPEYQIQYFASLCLNEPNFSHEGFYEKFSGNILSGLNGLFLLLSLCFFTSIRSLNKKLFEPKNWAIISLITFILVALLGAYFQDTTKFSPLFSKLPDVVFSMMLFLSLGLILGVQFSKRGSIELSAIAVFVCGLIVLSQYYLLTEVKSLSEVYSIDRPTESIKGYLLPRVGFNLMSLVFTSALGTIFLALAFTWIFEELKLKLLRQELKSEIQIREDRISDLESNLDSITNQSPNTSDNLRLLTETESKVFNYFVDNPNDSYSQAASHFIKSKHTIISHVTSIEGKLNVKGKENFASLVKGGN